MANDYILKRISDGQAFPVTEVSLIVGRSESCDIQVTEGHPSREHARVGVRAGMLRVEDLHSTNGTFVNGQKISAATDLSLADVVKFGDEAFSVQTPDQPDATVLMRSLGSQSANVSAMVVDDEEDEDDVDSTSFLEVYALPVGWSEEAFSSDVGVGGLDDKKRSAIDRYITKFSQSLKGKHEMFLVFLSQEDLPVIKRVVAGIGRDKWSVGRDESCDIVYENPCVSKRHGVISYSEGRWLFNDSESTNGVSVDGHRQTSIVLLDGMQLKISDVDVLVRVMA